MFTFLENTQYLCIFTDAPILHSKLQVEFLKFVSPKKKRVGETLIYFIKIQSEDMKVTWNISLFIFCMICNFSEYDGFTVLWIISIK